MVRQAREAAGLTQAELARRAGTSQPAVGMRRLRVSRPAIVKAARMLGVRNVRVFGSVARGEDLPGSDIDLLVDFDVHLHGAQALIQLRREPSELLGERVDVATVDLLRPEVAERALAEAVPL